MELQGGGAIRQTRKLQISGGTTHIISLPKEWVRGMGLKAGDAISMIRNRDNSMTLMPYSDGNDASGQATTRIGPNDSEESIRRRIISMYLAGYKSIRIMSKGIRLHPNQTNVIRDLARSSMIGTEIVESDSESIVIQILTSLPELSFDVALRRMYLMTINMHREAIDALADGNKPYAEEIVCLDDEIDRFSRYMLRNLMMAVQDARILQEMSLSNPADCLGYRTVVSRVERIADHAALIAKRIKYISGPIDAKMCRRIRGLSEDALGALEKAVKALAECDYRLAEETLDRISEIIEKQEAFMGDLNGSVGNSTVIKFILDDIRRTAEYSGDIAEVVMNRNICSVIAA